MISYISPNFLVQNFEVVRSPGYPAKLRPSCLLLLLWNTLVLILFSLVSECVSSPTPNHVCKPMKSSAEGSSLLVLVLQHSFPLSVNIKLPSTMLLDLQSFHLSSPATIHPSVFIQLVKFATSCNAWKTLSSAIHQSKKFCQVLWNCCSPVVLLGCQFNLSVLIYTALMLIWLKGLIHPKYLPPKEKKRYLNVATISSDGLLVMKRNEPLAPPQECIIFPPQVLHGLLTSLHIQLSHLPATNLRWLPINRYLFALDLDKAINQQNWQSGLHNRRCKYSKIILKNIFQSKH